MLIVNKREEEILQIIEASDIQNGLFIVPDKVTYFDAYVFRHNTKLTAIQMNRNTHTFGIGVFENSGLTSITMPDNVSHIGEDAFRRCVNLEKVKILSTKIIINQYAFSECTNLNEVTINSKIVKIEKGVFSACPNLRVVKILSSETSIGDDTFDFCTYLTQVTILGKVTKIGVGAFRNCSKLRRIIIPSGVMSIDKAAFNGCESLDNIELPDTLLTIETYVFAGCSSLSKITLPNKLTKIGWAAFQDCTMLNSISLPSSLIEIGLFAFDGCENLKQIIIDTDNLVEFERIKDLLPEHLRRFATHKTAVEIKQGLLDDFNFSCPVKGLRGTSKLNQGAHGNIAQFTEKSKEYQTLRKALETVPFDPSQMDFVSYKTELKNIVDKHVTAYHLQNYVDILEEQIPAGFFSEKRKPEKISNLEILQTHHTIKKIISFLQKGEGIELTTEEKSLLNTRPFLLSKIPQTIQQEIGFYASVR